MLLPTVINPKSPKPRNRGRHKVALTPKVACYVFFVLFNVGWFGYTMLSMRRRSPHRRPPQTAPDVYIRGTAQQQGPQHGRDGLLKQSIDIEQLEPMQSGLFQPGRVAVSLQPGAVDDLVVKGSLSSGDLKLSGSILSSSSGKLLVSAGVVGIGTSMVDQDHDKLVVNGPIRLGDAGTRPSCEISRRGMIWHEFGEMGQEDTVDICAKGRNDEYGWRPVVGGRGSRTQNDVTASIGAASSSGRAEGLSSSPGAGLLRDFRVAPGSEVQRGDVVTFVEGHAKRGIGAQIGDPAVFMDPGQAAAAGGAKRRTALLALGPNVCVILHGGGTGPQMVAQVAKVHGTAVELGGTKLQFGARRGDHVEMAKLSSTSFVVIYSDSSQRDVGYMTVGTIAGDVLRSFSKPLMLEPSGCGSLAIASLSPSVAVAAFNSNTASGRGDPAVMAIEVDGKAVSFGNRTKIDERLDGFVVVPMSAASFVLVHRNLRTKGVGARVGHISTAGVEVNGEDAEEGEVTTTAQPKAFIGKEVPLPTPGRILTYLTAAPLSASRLAVAYADANEGNVLLVDVAGGVAMPQSPVPFSSNKPLSLSMASLSEDSFILTFYSNDPWRAVVVKGTVQPRSQGGLSFTESLLSSEYSTHTHSAALSSHSFLTTYYDGANSDAGIAVVGLFGRGLGIAAASAAEGEMVPIRFGGISGEHTSLEVGACYYSTEEGHITTGVTGQRVGMAISVNDIMMGSC